jgi:hypothetical protein
MMAACFDIPVKQASRDNVEGYANYFVLGTTSAYLSLNTRTNLIFIILSVFTKSKLGLSTL